MHKDQELLGFAKELAREAGALALKWRGHHQIRLKADRSVVTDADLDVQRLIRARIAERFPEHAFVGEEGEATSKAPAPATWIVDPIDGTDPYSRGLPGWMVSIGLLVAGRPTLGVLYAAATDELYWAMAGQGAFLGEVPIQVDEGTQMGGRSLLLVPSNLHQVARPTSQGKVQGYGSNCLHLALVARGSAQATVLGASQVWDYLAAAIILKEAGGALFSLKGEALNIGALARERQFLVGAVACHPNRLAAVFDSVDVDLPPEIHGFTGQFKAGTF